MTQIFTQEETMIVVNVAIESSESDIAELKSAIAIMESASQAEEGCDDYTFSIELNNPNVIRITERWHNMAALERHFKTSHMVVFQAAMAKFPSKARQMNFYEATEVTPPGR
jgi:quinol monooxygenase YgiN